MKRCLTVLALTFILVSVRGVCAQSTIPFAKSFESLAEGTSILTNAEAGSWGGIADATAIVTNVTYQPVVSYPLPSEEHAKIVVFSGSISNSFVTTTETNIYIDAMIQPMFSDELPVTASVTNSQVSVAFNTNGYPCVFHGVANAWDDLSSNTWSVFSTASVASGKWVRVTIAMSYDFDANGRAAFKVQVNGVDLSNDYGYSTVDFGTAVHPGPWFRAAIDYSLLGVSEVALSGTGGLDDLVVSTEVPVIESSVAPNGIPFQWLVDQGLTTNDYAGDPDLDGMSTWAEWVAGTQPTNPFSFLGIVGQSISNNGSAVISWLSSGLALAPYTFEVSSNLVNSGWNLVTGVSQSASGEGTKTQALPAPVVTPAYYRVTITP